MREVDNVGFFHAGVDAVEIVDNAAGSAPVVHDLLRGPDLPPPRHIRLQTTDSTATRRIKYRKQM
jgi:hypothetical protein